MEVTYSSIGIFRHHPYWIVAFGEPAGKNTLSPKTEMRLTNQGLRRFYSALLAAKEQAQTSPPECVTLPLIQPPTWVTWQSLGELIHQVERRVRQLDSSQPIPDSEIFQTGGLN